MAIPRVSLSCPADVRAGSFAARRLRVAPNPLAAELHERLLEAALGAVDTPVCRRPSISLDGTPVVYSCSIGDRCAPLRVLVEPGGLARDIAAQIDFTLSTLDDLFGLLDWRAAAPDVNLAARAILPPSAEDARMLWGGAWLGLAAGTEFELRLYLSLRHGTERARWQRAVDALAGFADPSAEPLLASLVDRVVPLAVPVGLGVVVAAGRLRGLRLYVGVRAPTRDTLLALMEAPQPARETIDLLCKELGPFGPQSVTAGYDFAVRDGVLEPAFGRVKLDVDCFERGDRERTIPALRRVLRGCDLEVEELEAFVCDMDDCFGGSAMHYASVGLEDGPSHVTVYAQPAGYALP